jgi:probable F420-dependent oxidoreductase
MQFGFCLPNFDGTVTPDRMVESGVLAEELGFDSVWSTDHVIVPRENLHPYGILVEALISLSYVAARTERIKLGTSVIVLTQRNPILVAKQAAALDVLSHGRLILGLGAGWLKPEFDFLGEDFRKRGRRFDESIRLMRSIWSENLIGFSGEFFKLEDAVSLPHPRKPIPLLIAGASEAALLRAASLGDGWHPVGITPEELKKGVEKIRAKNRRAIISARLQIDLGKKKNKEYVSASGQMQVGLAGSAGQITDQIEQYISAGLQHVALVVTARDSRSLTASMRSIAREIMPSFK